MTGATSIANHVPPTIERVPIRGKAVPRMASTWHHRPRSEWNFFQRTLVDMHAQQALSNTADRTAVKVDGARASGAGGSGDGPTATAGHTSGAKAEPPPVFEHSDPVPVYSVLSQHRWVFPRAIAPLLANWFFSMSTGRYLPNWLAGGLYLAYFIWYGSDLFGHLQRMTQAYGFFDGHKPRDGIPDIEVANVTLGLLAVIVLRVTFAFSMLYPQTAEGQSTMLNWKWALLLPLNAFVYACAIDFWFYWYHRLMHEVPFLWRFHRKHHTTKHPIAALGSFADHEQEIFDMLLIPLAAYLVWPIDFSTWWVSTTYTLYIEAAGHSGLRSHFTNPVTAPVLGWIGCSLVIEDHDLHHRKGWKRATNYGKQTRLWDFLFGSMGERIEGVEGNVDWNQKLKLL